MSLEQIYAQIPEIKCRGKCQASCGPIGMSPAEAEIVGKVSAGSIRFRAYDEMVMVENFDRQTMRCPALQNGRCSIYAHRPLICRLWGVVKKMRCPHGCRPKRWLSDAEARTLLDAAMKIPLTSPPPRA